MKLIKSPAPPAYPTVTALLKGAAAGREDQLLFAEEWNGGRRITYGQWLRDLLETAGKMQQLEAQHIGLVCDLTYSCVLCLYAVFAAGKVLVPLEADLEAEALEACIQKADIDLLLYPKGRIDGSITGCTAMEIPEFLSRPAAALPEWPEWEEDRDACIVFTSGTEGQPRGALLTQRNLAAINHYIKYADPRKQTRTLLYLPIHHIFSIHTITSCMSAGTRMHLIKGPQYLSRAMEAVRPDVLITVPLINGIFHSMVQKGIAAGGKAEAVARLIRLSNFLRKLGLDLRDPLFRPLRESLGGIPQLLISGGSAAAEDTIRYFEDIGIIILQAYGMTETAGHISTNLVEQNRIGSVGQAHRFSEIRIVDSEIQVRSRNVMKAYYKDPQATAAAFQDGWFRTGDLGYLDPDGYLFLTGRKKNLIILGTGENVSPEELENRLLRDPAVAEVVVREKDGRIHAEIFPELSACTEEAAAENQIREAIDALNRKNPLYKRITSWQLRSEPFEKTSSAKIRR